MEKKRDVKAVFSKQHYELLAETISANNEDSIFDLVYSLTLMFKKDNPRFDMDEFMNKCFPLEASK